MNMVQVYFMRGGGKVPVCHLESFALVSCTEETLNFQCRYLILQGRYSVAESHKK